MKTLFTLLFLLTSYAISAQNYHLSKSHDFAASDTFANQLFTLDNKPNSLFLVRILNTEPINVEEPLLRYFLYESINGGEFQQLTIPSVDYIISSAGKTTWGAMFQVITEDMGQELMFFDGNQFTVVDLVPGEFDSHGFCRVKDDRIFISRYTDENHSHWALYEFIDVNNIVQISDTYEANFCQLNNVIGDTVFYSVHDDNGTTLKQSVFDNGGWSQEEIWSSSAYTSILSPISMINEKFIFAVLEGDLLVSNETYRVIVVDNTNTTILLQESGSFPFDFQWKVFQHNDKFYYSSYFTNSLYTTSNGVDFNVVLSPSEGTLIQHVIKDNTLYFLVEKVVNGVTAQCLLKNINFQNQIVYTGSKVAIINSPDDFYLIEKSFAVTNASVLLKILPDGSILNWPFNNNYETFVFTHSYYFDNGAVVQDKLYVVFTEKLPSDVYKTDIYILQATNGVSILDESNFKLYPNPISNDELLIIDGVVGESIELIDCSGRMIETFSVVTNKAVIQLKNRNPGVYYIRINGAVEKLIIQ